MSLLTEILDYNKTFIDEKLYEAYTTTKFPDKKLVILTCMDTRLVELLHKAMNMKNGDVKVVKTAGAVVKNPFGSIMRSLLIAVYELKADEVYVIGHHDCGMSMIESEKMLEHMTSRGITQETIDIIKNSGVKLDQWLEGFDSVELSVEHSVNMIRNHPLMADEIPVHGLVIDPETGKLDLVVDGYDR
ncbi:beta-class carbonic anhydrase [Lederbergia lenta]|uniref:carbonic anhydrase n=1 Tax=Lederbergia lenta TaxID=1467 RepID=A0A2X4VTH5_LEDLE|nr:carbonic anhydrase [Lederbergia lenta]MCM3111010.1 carbonic anhydrase [Lederbergia lenta]MEC2325602.1 carbonic anhydrase [Lederbergia lenta]SQI54183.1 YtiB protein [Lederbergia lenta]